MNKVIAFAVFICSAFSVSSAQVTGSQPGNETLTQNVLKTQDEINKILFDAGILFKDGLFAYEDSKLTDSGEKFNASVEIFLHSKINIQREQKLQSCYDQLIETIYRIEFPTENRLPQIGILARTCGWNDIDTKLADKVAMLAKSSIAKPLETPLKTESVEFEPSPLDDLSKLELTSDPQKMENKPGVSQYPRIVKAKGGDTVAKVAERYGVDATEVAKYNGLLPLSILKAGREIKIPWLGVSDAGPIFKPEPTPTVFSETNQRATSRCNLTLKRAPALRGLKLGMTTTQVLRILGANLKISEYKFLAPGVSAMSWGGLGAIKIPALDGIDLMGLRFYKNSLYIIWFNYAKGDIEWKDQREFSMILSEKLKLPQSAWSVSRFGASTECKGFSISADISKDGSSYIFLRDKVIDQLISAKENQSIINEERRKKDEELDKKRVFKP